MRSNRNRKNPFPNASSYRDRHKKLRWRYRKNGRTVQLHGEFGSSEFKKSYELAVNGQVELEHKSSAERGSFGWLIEQYRQTPSFMNLAPTSKKTQFRLLERFREEHGHRMVADLKSRHVEVLMAKKSETPAAANSLLKTIKKLCRYAITRDIISSDPTRGLMRFTENPDGFHTWTVSEIEQFEGFHGIDSKAVLALRLLIYSGGSKADCVKFGWQNVSNGRFRYRRQKTKVDVDLPLRDELNRALAHAEAGNLLFITHSQGRAYKPTTFGSWFRKMCDQAGLPNCTSHGVRKYGATSMAENGATEWDIMSYLGHKTPDEARTYVKAASRGKLGDRAMNSLSVANPVVRLANNRSK